ncbi:MAG: hypothetical protein Q7S58_03250 [Candidatus Binatus sp.]|uniref:hypothetical protein n=1 Tax=Candidatus Binatus sp. TaxID=2811406 RepID=UPI002720A8D5|nr:hypothetical protein [Candidatus Binatus sp.]MDO8431406.1 hypothetical protein [Candidatus Binatus sp.]
MKIPHSGGVDRMLKQAVGEIRAVRRLLNQQSAKLLSRSAYEAASATIALARSVEEFQLKIEGMRREWRALKGIRRDASNSKDSATPQWKFYPLILKTLLKMGGQATPKALERELEPLIASLLKEGDSILLAGGRPRWKAQFRRARIPMMEQGFLEQTPGKWTITSEGRRLASLPEDTS